MFSVKEIDETVLKAITSEWINMLGTSSSTSTIAHDYDQLFTIIDTNKSYGALLSRKDKPTYLAVTKDDDQSCLSLMEVIYTKKGSVQWAKMVDAYFCPFIEDLPVAEFNVQHELVLRAIILHLINALSFSAQDEVKIYARNDVSMNFIQQFSRHAASKNLASTGIDVVIEGRWLVFRSS